MNFCDERTGLAGVATPGTANSPMISSTFGDQSRGRDRDTLER